MRTRKADPLPAERHYFVDEAGDSVLFGKRGKVMIGQDGCSRFFMMGCLEVADSVALAADVRLQARLVMDLDDLRKAKYGMWSSDRMPLTLDALRGRPGDTGISGQPAEHTA